MIPPTMQYNGLCETSLHTTTRLAQNKNHLASILSQALLLADSGRLIIAAHYIKAGPGIKERNQATNISWPESCREFVQEIYGTLFLAEKWRVFF